MLSTTNGRLEPTDPPTTPEDGLKFQLQETEPLTHKEWIQEFPLSWLAETQIPTRLSTNSFNMTVKTNSGEWFEMIPLNNI